MNERYIIMCQARGVDYYYTELRTWSPDRAERVLMDYRTALREANGLQAPRGGKFNIFPERA